jgi:hypothetical protein
MSGEPVKTFFSDKELEDLKKHAYKAGAEKFKEELLAELRCRQAAFLREIQDLTVREATVSLAIDDIRMVWEEDFEEKEDV